LLLCSLTGNTGSHLRSATHNNTWRITRLASLPTFIIPSLARCCSIASLIAWFEDLENARSQRLIRHDPATIITPSHHHRITSIFFFSWHFLTKSRCSPFLDRPAPLHPWRTHHHHSPLPSSRCRTDDGFDVLTLCVSSWIWSGWDLTRPSSLSPCSLLSRD
jgi:hypothetical protein